MRRGARLLWYSVKAQRGPFAISIVGAALFSVMAVGGTVVLGRVTDDVLTRYIEAIIYQTVAENMASEQSARMVAMKAASDNAGTLIDELTLVYNKNRQAAITKEIAEIVGGAAAV